MEEELKPSEQNENELEPTPKKFSLPKLTKKTLIIISIVALLIISAASYWFFSYSKGQTEPVLTKISGVLQKGPFISGSRVTIQTLDENLEPTGSSYELVTNNDFGEYSFSGLFDANYVEIISSGYYFNENSGQLSTGPINLRSLAGGSDEITVNVNLLTTLSLPRIKYLVTQSGLSFNEAKAQAEQEILNIFGINEETITGFELMDLSSSGEKDAVLLALSTILQGSNTEAQLSELVSKLSLDLEKDGTLDDTSLTTALETNASELQIDSIKTNLADRYEALGQTITVPDFETYVKRLVEFNVLSTNPTKDATDVNPSSTVSVVFSKELDQSTLTTQSFIVKSDTSIIDGNLEYDSQTRKVTFTPTTEFEYSPSNESKPLKEYTVTITQNLLSVDGASLNEEYTLKFSMKRLSPVKISKYTPTDDSVDVDPDTTVSITFDKALDENSVSTTSIQLFDESGNSVSSQLTLDEARKQVTLTPTSRLSSEKKHTVNVADSVTAQDKSTLDRNYEWSFTVSRLDISSDLLIYYPFNGNTQDASGNGNDAENIGTTLTQDKDEKADSAYHFEEDQYMKIPAVKRLWEEPWTITMRLYIEDPQRSEKNYYHYIFAYGDPDKLGEDHFRDSPYDPRFPTYLAYEVDYQTQDRIATYRLQTEESYLNKFDELDWWQNPSYIREVDEEYMMVDSWDFISMSYDTNKNIKVLINGQEPECCKFEHSFIIENNADYYYLGYPMVSGVQYPFIGNIDEFRLYDRALNQYEVRELYNQ